MRKTKIVATVGPASDSARALRQLIRGGVDVFRLNMSHGDHASHRRVIRSIRKIAEEHNLPTAILVDLQGPKLRLGTFEGGQAELAARQRFTLTTRKIQGNRDTVSIDAPSFPRFVRGGDRILMDDGLLVLEVLEVVPRGCDHPSGFGRNRAQPHRRQPARRFPVGTRRHRQGRGGHGICGREPGRLSGALVCPRSPGPGAGAKTAGAAGRSRRIASPDRQDRKTSGAGRPAEHPGSLGRNHGGARRPGCGGARRTGSPLAEEADRGRRAGRESR